MGFRAKSNLSLISRIFILLLGLSLIGFKGSRGHQLDSDGGYHVTVGLDAPILDPSLAQAYVDNVQTVFKTLSVRMHATSQNQFYLKSVTIVTTPEFGVDDETYEISLRESFQKSDIKVSDLYPIPDVLRPTTCQLPGSEIRLPTQFFNEETDELYHVKDKALLHLWAQYRWGVFEESGFPGNTRFPYFAKNLESWEVNACSDTKLVGSYLSSEGACVLDDLTIRPDTDCRFVPESLGNDCQSSMMNNFYWIESMDSFCTSDTHNPLLQNRQNLFCSGQSVTDVMVKSPDWVKVSEPLIDIPEPIFKIVKASPKPLVYILLDNRVMTIPNTPIRQIRTELKKLFDPLTGVVSDGLLGALSQYPPLTSSEEDHFEEIFPWTLLTPPTAAEFAEKIDSTISINENPEGLFGAALKEILESIKSRRHEAGALIFVFKASSTPDFESMPFESDVLGSLISQSIRLFAVEVSSGSGSVADNLIDLTTASGGSHLLVSPQSDIPTELSNFVSEFVEASKNPGFSDASPVVVFKDFIDLRDEVPKTVELLVGNPGQVSLTLTSPIYLENVAFSSTTGIIEVTERNEWNEQYGLKRRFTFIGTVVPVPGEVLSINYNCPSGSTENCKALLMIRTENSDMTVDVSTPLEITDFDFTDSDAAHVPIFAHVERNGVALIELNEKRLEASATLCLEKLPTECWRIALTDNGAGIPDLLSNDGILSGVFVPPIVGRYKAWVSISYDKTRRGISSDGPEVVTYSRGTDARKSVDQNLFPCSLSYGEGCVGAAPPNSFQIVADVPSVINVLSLPTNPGPVVPAQILDLIIIASSENDVTLSWTSPAVFVNGGLETVEKYDIRFCLEEINDPENCDSIEFTGDPSEAGTKERLEYQMQTDELHFFIIRTSYLEQISPISNAVSLKPNEDPIVIPSTTETVTVPTTVTSTVVTTTIEPQTESTTDSITTSEVSTDSNPTSEGSTDSSPTSEASTLSTDSSPTSEVSTDSNPTSEVVTDSTVAVTNSTTKLTTRDSGTTNTPITTESSEYFFKKPIGYITAAGIALVAVGLIGGAVGYLCWKRNAVLSRGKLFTKTP